MKALVRQRACPEGSMVEGYMVYQSLVYVSQYLAKLAVKILKVPQIWDVNSINKFNKWMSWSGKVE